MKRALVDINFYRFLNNDAAAILKKAESTLLYTAYLPRFIACFIFYRTSFTEKQLRGNVQIQFLKSKAYPRWWPLLSFFKHLKKINPDFILIHGLGYSIQAYFLRLFLSKKPVILIQVHGYAPAPKRLKKYIYKWSQAYVNGYIFTGIANAKPWIDKGIFASKKVFEVMEGATQFKYNSRIVKSSKSFLWVGRLNSNKDPITILKAFSQFLKVEPEAKLTLVYQTEELLPVVMNLKETDIRLKNSIILKGKVSHDHMEYLYQSHQYFVLGSHFEGSGYALLEAMACACIPIVTHIPSFKYMTNAGRCGLLFEPSDVSSCLKAFKRTKLIDISRYQNAVLKQFKDRLSAQAIARTIAAIFQDFAEKKQS